jgi:hypothetical protein
MPPRLKLLVPLAFGLLSSACVITTSGDGEGDDGLGGGGGASASNGTGGQGSTSSGSSQTGAGGGINQCVGPDGQGMAQASCDMTNVGLLGVCPSDGLEPFAVDVCHRGFEIYTQGSWENLLSCLGEIPAAFEEACDEPQASMNVGECVQKMYDEACANPESDALCAQIDEACTADGQTFPVDLCNDDLLPFGAGGRQAYVDCYETGPAELTCGEIHSYCFDLVTEI